MAAADYFLKLDGIDGESIDSKHKNEIEIQSFSWSGHQAHNASSAGAGLSRGKFQGGTLDCHTSLSKETPKLFTSLFTGQHIKTGVLTLRKSGGTKEVGVDYCFWKLTEVAISHLSLGGGQGSVPSVSFSLAFSKVEFEYKSQKADGTFATASTAVANFATGVSG